MQHYKKRSDYMNFVTTNIRLPEEEYIKLKAEAAKKRKSLAAIIRQKLTSEKHILTKTKVQKMMKELDRVAERNGKILKGWDSVKALREIRYSDK